jgi:hypothetical protein
LYIRRIGDWITSLRDDQDPAPQELVIVYDPTIRQALADYLDSGVEIASYRCTTQCCFDCDASQSQRDLCDGVWSWPSDLGHYVRDHSVGLPPEFVDHALSHEMPSELPGFDRNDCGDDEYWREWCMIVRDAGFVVALRDAKAEADTLAAIEQADYIENTVREFEANLGLSAEKCQWRNCERNALRERAFCALHLGTIPLQSPRQSGFYRVAPLLKSYFGSAP